MSWQRFVACSASICIHLHPIWANVFKMPLRLTDPSHGGKKGSISPTIWKEKTTYLSRFERWMVFPSSRFMSLKGWSKTLKPPLKHRASFACVIGSSLGKDSFMSCRVVHLVWGCLEDIRILRWETPAMTRALLVFLFVLFATVWRTIFCRKVNEWTPIQSSFASRKPPLYPGLPTRRWSRWSRLGEGGGSRHPDSFKCEFDKMEMRHADVFL